MDTTHQESELLSEALLEPQQLDVAAEGELGEPQILVFGCGGAGGNTINRLSRMGLRGTIALNTDKQALDQVEADKKILVGKTITRGLGSGGYPDVAERCAEAAHDKIAEMLQGADLVFVTAGMGGGTGTGTAPVVARLAREMGAVVVAMVSTPFAVERARAARGEEGLSKLRECADSVIVLDNNRLLRYVPNLPIDQAFSVMDQLIAETVKGLSETLTQPSLMNLDVADLKAVVGQGGLAVMLWGEARLADGPEAVVREALNHPLLDADHAGATGALVHVTGGPDMTLEFAHDVATRVTSSLGDSAAVKWGARILPQFEGRCRVMAIMTGIRAVRPAREADVVPTPVAPVASETFVPDAVEIPVPEVDHVAAVPPPSPAERDILVTPAVPAAAPAAREPEPMPEIEMPRIPTLPSLPSLDGVQEFVPAIVAPEPAVSIPKLEEFEAMPPPPADVETPILEVAAPAGTLELAVPKAAGPSYELPPKAAAPTGPVQMYGIDFIA